MRRLLNRDRDGWGKSAKQRGFAFVRDCTFCCMGIGEEPDQIGLVLFENRNRLTACEARLDFMPVADGLFAELPAEADVVAAVAADEIDESGLEVLHVATDAVEFVDVILQEFHRTIEVFLESGLILGLGRGEGSLVVGHAVVGFDDVADDAPDKGKCPAGFGECESLDRVGRGYGPGG
jgi:hypothetical protein